MKNYLYILYFSNGKYLKIGVSSKSIHRVKQLSKIYDIDFEKSLIFETSRKISLSLERSLLSVSTPLNENPFVNLDGCTEIRDIEYLEYFMDILKLHIVQHNIKVNKIRTFITIHNNELIDNEKVKKLINWVELSGTWQETKLQYLQIEFL